MAESDFKLPSSSFDELTKIIQAYAMINKPASLDDVSRRIGMHPTMISANNGFLVALGVLSTGKSKAITPSGKQLGDALSHGIEDETRRLWKQFVDESEFLRNIVSAIRIRRGMEEASLKAHIAYSAGVSKSASVTTGAGALIELLKQAGAIVDEDGKFVVSASTDMSSSSDSSVALTQAAVSEPVKRNLVVSGGQGSISLSIEVRINCSAEQIDGLGAKLRSIVEEFNSEQSAEE